MSEVKLGTTINTFLRLKGRITVKNKEIDELKSQASELEMEIIKGLEKQGTTRGDVKGGSVTIKESTVWSAKDWKKVWGYIFKNKDSSLLQKRLSQGILNEMMEDKKKVPGTEKMTKKILSIGRKQTV